MNHRAVVKLNSRHQHFNRKLPPVCPLMHPLEMETALCLHALENDRGDIFRTATIRLVFGPEVARVVSDDVRFAVATEQAHRGRVAIKHHAIIIHQKQGVGRVFKRFGENFLA